MRELGFKIWDKKENKFLPESALKEFSLNALKANGIDFEFLEYTGLKDKNGKEIFEGDVVKHPCYNEGNLVVQWDYSGWGLFWRMCNELCLDNDCEIIGNIYEHSYLLDDYKKGGE